MQSVIEARRFLSRLFDFHYEEECNEMLPSWNDRLNNSIELIRKALPRIPEDKRDMYRAAITRGDTCKESMTVIEFKKIDIK